MQRKTCMLIIPFILGLLMGFIQYQTVGIDLTMSSPMTATVHGTYSRIGERLYGQALGAVNGLCIQGVNAFPGQKEVTDLLMVGTSGSGSWRGLQGYNASAYPGYYILQSSNDNAVVDMLKFEDSILNKSFVIYGEAGSSTGRLVKQSGTPRSYSSGIDIIPDGYITTDPIIALCTGNFDADADPEVAAIGTTGEVSAMMDLDFPTAGSKFADLEWASSPNRRQIKNPIVAIENLDISGASWQDLIVGHSDIVYAISTNFSTTPIIWSIDIGGLVGSCVVTPDVNEDGYDDVVVAASNGLYLLSGKTGVMLTSRTNIGSYFRDAILFADYSNDTVPEILTGNWQGDVILWDINPDSDHFGEVVLNLTKVGGRITTFLELPDLNADESPEYAVGGGNGFLGVILKNGTWYWKTGVSGSGIWLNPWYIDLYDIALLDDRNGDEWPDLAVTGSYETLDSGAFIYSSQGGFEFQPDLHGFGYVDNTCGTPNHEFSFTLTAYQKNNVTVTAQVEIDGEEYPMEIISSTLNWTKGVKSEYNTTLALGSHEYRFLLTDGIDSIAIPSTDVTTLEVKDVCETCSDCSPSLNISGSVEVIGISAVITVLVLIRGIRKGRRHA